MLQPLRLAPLIRQQLVREYYFSEALAFYENYYAPISESMPVEEEPDDRQADRPVTWAPLLFHATTVDNLGSIVESGALRPGKKGYTSFTEMPLGELDRLITRKRGRRQVAIAFPRRTLQRYGFTSVWYLKHNPEIRAVVESLLKDHPELAPYVDLDGDVGSFAEVRVTGPIPISEAVWILSSERFTPEAMPGWLKTFRREYATRYGLIATSFWHRSHLEGILGEWNFIRLRQDGDAIESVEIRGEHYWRMAVQKNVQASVSLPDKDRHIGFTMTDHALARQWTGPYSHWDTARFVERLLAEAGEDTELLLLDRLIRFPREPQDDVHSYAADV